MFFEHRRAGTTLLFRGIGAGSMAQSLAGGVCQLRMMPEAHWGRILKERNIGPELPVQKR
jgi:hypothetical protein